MNRLTAVCVRAIVYAWIPIVAALSISAVWAQSPISESSGVHLSVGVISIIVGIVAFVGPGFYLLGRYDHRLSTTETELVRITDQMERLVERGIHTGDRVAVALEAANENGIAVTCPLAADCPHPSMKHPR